MSILPPSLLRWHASPDLECSTEIVHDPSQGLILSGNATIGTVSARCRTEEWTQAVPSWQTDTPSGTAVEILLRAECDGRWTGWYHLGWWSSDADLRHSVEDQEDADGKVATDTFMLKHSAQALEWRVVLHGKGGLTPALRTMAVAIGPVPESEIRPVPGAVEPLAVPELSQMVYPNGGRVWCSPTSLTMLLGYWHAQTADPKLVSLTMPEAVPEIVAPAVYDAVYGGTGNWPFNTAFAASLGLEGYVLQLRGLDDIQQLLTMRVPSVISIGWKPGELEGAPVGHSNGHLVVVVGLTEQGDVIVNDPAADPRKGDTVRRMYPREQLLKAWMHSNRTAYLVYPPGWIL